MSNILDHFGIKEMPWIMKVYLLLFFSSIILILLPGLQYFNFSEERTADIVKIGIDSLKIVIGAVIGSLSMAAQREWGKGPNGEEGREQK